jgi:MFS family permease
MSHEEDREKGVSIMKATSSQSAHAGPAAQVERPLPLGRPRPAPTLVLAPPALPAFERITSTRKALAMSLSLMFVFVTTSLTLSAISIITPELQSTFGYSHAQIGLLTSIYMGFFGLSGITAGVVASRFGGRLLAITCGCFVLGSALFALSSSFGAFMIARALQGVAGGSVVPICNPVINNAISERCLKRCWALFGAGWGLGGLLALVAMPSVDNAWGFRGVFLTAAAIAFVVGLVALSQKAVRRLPPRSAAVSFRGMGLSLAGAARNFRVLLLGFCGTAHIAAAVGLVVWTPSFFSDHMAAGSSMAVYLVAGVGASQLIGNPLGALAAGKWGRHPVIVAMLITMAVSLVAIALAPGILLATVLVLVAGFCSFGLFAPMHSYFPYVVKAPEQVGPSAGIHTIMGFAGSLVAPWLFGIALDAGHRSLSAYLAGYCVLAAFSVAAAIGMAFFRPRSVSSRPVGA